MAIPAYIDNGGIDSAVSTTVDVSFMGTIDADDILLAHVIAGALDTWSTPSGWTLIGSIQRVTDILITYAVFWKRATGSESGTETFTFGTSDTLAGVISRYSGCITSGSPIEDPALLSGFSLTEDTEYYFDSLTTTDTDRLGVILLGVGNNVLGVVPSGWADEYGLTSTVGTDSALSMFSLDIATAQTISAGSGSLARFNPWATCILALIPDTGGVDNLTSTDIETQSVDIDTPDIGQVHVITSTDVETQNSEVTNATLGQEHALTSNNIEAQNVVIGTPTLSESNELTSTDIETQNPVVENATIGQIHALLSSIIESQNPVIESATLGQEHVLISTDIESQAVVIGTPTLSESHELTATNIEAQNVVIENSTIGQIHVLISNAIETESPVIGTPTLAEVGNVDNLTATDIETAAPIIQLAILGQIHDLLAGDITSGNPSIGNPIIDDGNFVPFIKRKVCGNKIVPSFTASIKRETCVNNIIPTFTPFINRKRCTPLEAIKIYNLAANSINSANPVIQNSSIRQTHILSFDNVVSQNPIVESPTAAIKGIFITMNMSTPSTAGFNLTFTGSIDIDFKEGGGLEALTSGVEKTHVYTTPATYITEITGDLGNITKFIADNSKITFISGLVTGLLTDFKINNNLFSGVLDMSLAAISGIFYVNNNTELTDITFAGSGNGTVTDFRAHICGIVGNFDVSNITVGTAFRTFSNPLLTDITFASSGNSKLTIFESYSCDLTGNFSLSNVSVSGYFDIRGNSNLTGIAYASSGNTIITTFRGFSCNFSSLDFSNVPIGSLFIAHSNSNMTGITFATSGNSKLTTFQVQSCNLTGTLDLSNNPISYIQVAGNPLLTDVTFSASGNTAFTLTGMNLSAFNYVDFSGVTLMLARNSVNHHFEDNNMIAGDLNHILVDLAALVAGESGGGDFTGRTLTMNGTNAAPDGSSGGFDGDQAVIDLTAKGITVTTS